MSSPTILNEALVIRRASAQDARALQHLAELDSHRPLDGEVVLAESGGRPVAALEVRTGEVAADPFVRTAGVVRMLRGLAVGR